VSQRIHLYQISIGADLPSAGIHNDDQYGPDVVDDTGDVVAVRSSEETWLIRLQPGIHQKADIYSFPGGRAFVVNNKGNVYWIDAAQKKVVVVESRYQTFATHQAPSGEVVAFDFSDACLLDQNGLRWRVDDLSRDELDLQQLDDRVVTFSRWLQSPSDTEIVRISLLDGTSLS
jgi:hypothetical protein